METIKELKLEAVRRFWIGRRVITLVAKPYIMSYLSADNPKAEWKVLAGMAIKCPWDKPDGRLAYQIASGRAAWRDEHHKAFTIRTMQFKPSKEQLYAFLEDVVKSLIEYPYYIRAIDNEGLKLQRKIDKAKLAMHKWKSQVVQDTVQSKGNQQTGSLAAGQNKRV
jgi:IS4 transposase